MDVFCHLNLNKRIWAGQQALSRVLYTNVTERSFFSVFADKLFKVLGMAAIVPSSKLLPPPALFPAAHSRTVSHNDKKLKNADVVLASFLFTGLHAEGRIVGEVTRTALNYSYRLSLLDPPFGCFPPLSHFFTVSSCWGSLMFPVVSSKLIQTKWSVLKKKIASFRYVSGKWVHQYV